MKAAWLLVLGLAAPAFADQVVVLDPGHGGAESGAKTAAGTEEKTVTLAVARHAQAALQRAGVKVLLTRETDRTVRLAERLELAHRQRASLFVSIHANSSPVAGRRGVETYVVAAEASDEEAAELVETEDSEEAAPIAHSLVEGIVADLEKSGVQPASARLSELVEGHLGRVPALAPSRGLRQAPFWLLRYARVPAVLVELGYLSHAEQGAALAREGTQREAGRALAEAVLAYLGR